MINRLYIEKRADGGYDVVCNNIGISIPAPKPISLGWFERYTDIVNAIEVLTQPQLSGLENPDDVTVARVGYQVNGLLAVAYGGEVVYVPDFRLGEVQV